MNLFGKREPGRPRSHERGYGERRRRGYGGGQAAALGRFRSDGRKTIGGLLMDDGFLANPARVSRGNWVIGYLLLVMRGAGRFFVFDPRSTIFDPLGDLGGLAVNLFGWGEVDPR